MNSPLGKYSQIVAAGLAVAIVGCYLIALVFGETLGVSQSSTDKLAVVALIAIGAVFGSAAAVNGVKAPLDAAHNRIDKLESVTGIQTHGTYPVRPCPTIGCVLAEGHPGDHVVVPLAVPARHDDDAEAGVH